MVGEDVRRFLVGDAVFDILVGGDVLVFVGALVGADVDPFVGTFVGLAVTGDPVPAQCDDDVTHQPHSLQHKLVSSQTPLPTDPPPHVPTSGVGD